MIALLVLIVEFLVAAQELKQIHVVYRHGARNQIFDNWNWAKYQDVAGLLTGPGYHQHFVLGQWLRSRYVDELKLLSPQYDQSEIFVRSTDSDRTLQSAYSNLYGLYPLGADPILPDNVPLVCFLPPIFGIENLTINENANIIQPIPVHSLPMEYDGMLAFWSNKACPNNPKIHAKNVASQDYQSLVNLTVDIRHQFEIQMGLTADSVDLQALSDYADTFIVDKFNGYDLPPSLTSIQYEELVQIYTLQNHLIYFGDAEFTKALTTPFFENVISNMDSIGPSSRSLKAIIYSAHDTNLLGFLDRLNLTSVECMMEVFSQKPVTNSNCIYTHPGYASNLIFELYQSENDGDLYVQVLFNGTVLPICGSDRCPYDELKTILQQSSRNYEENCFQATNVNFQWFGVDYHIMVLISIQIAIMISFTLLCFVYVNRVSRRILVKQINEQVELMILR